MGRISNKQVSFARIDLGVFRAIVAGFNQETISAGDLVLMQLASVNDAGFLARAL